MQLDEYKTIDILHIQTDVNCSQGAVYFSVKPVECREQIRSPAEGKIAKIGQNPPPSSI